ncbi:MAG TPA: hypothetical protein VIM01_05290, partial [Dermatophilaceae bacterium]
RLRLGHQRRPGNRQSLAGPAKRSGVGNSTIGGGPSVHVGTKAGDRQFRTVFDRTPLDRDARAGQLLDPLAGQITHGAAEISINDKGA